MARGTGRADNGPDFVEALARGLDIIRAMGAGPGSATLSEIAAAAGLARPTTRRLLLTLEALGYVKSSDGNYLLTPRVLELGTAHIAQQGLWQLVEPHLQALSRQTGESTSVAQLDGSDIVYVCRVAVPKIITLQVSIGTRFPAYATSLGKVLLADLAPERMADVITQPSRSGIEPRWQPSLPELQEELARVRAQGWAVTDEQLALGIRSVAAPLRDGSGRVVAAVNISAHAPQTPLEEVNRQLLPALLTAAGAISSDIAMLDRIPAAEAGAAP